MVLIIDTFEGVITGYSQNRQVGLYLKILHGIFELDFQSVDEFTVAYFFECLTFRGGDLRLRTDYVRGRSMKTEVTIRPDGSVTLTT